MTRLSGLSPWHQTVSTHLPGLSQPQLKGLVLWSIGIVLAQSCGLTTVATLLAYVLERREAAVQEQLRDWYRDGADKRGAKHGVKRRSLEVETCFAPLLRWVISLFPDTCRQLALAMDASTLGQRFTILSIHVVVCGCAIPVAWHIVEATRPGAWRPHWERLFACLDGAVPSDWKVIVAADRGLYAKWLYQTITALGWHPLLRINRQGQYCPAGERTFRPLSQVVAKNGPGWAGRVTCFATKERQLDCTLLARWTKPQYRKTNAVRRWGVSSVRIRITGGADENPEAIISERAYHLPSRSVDLPRVRRAAEADEHLALGQNGADPRRGALGGQPSGLLCGSGLCGRLDAPAFSGGATGGASPPDLWL
jgi:hypothetical protein